MKIQSYLFKKNHTVTYSEHSEVILHVYILLPEKWPIRGIHHGPGGRRYRIFLMT